MNSAEAFTANGFVDVARGFCAWCEDPIPKVEIEAQAAGWICRLYAAALALPKIAPENAEGLPEIPSQLLGRASANLAQFNGWYYREFFDPHPLLDDPSGMGDVGDDLLDIYKDVRAGLILFEHGQPLTHCGTGLSCTVSIGAVMRWGPYSPCTACLSRTKDEGVGNVHAL